MPVRRAIGGTIPGLLGESREAILHGGEFVLSADTVQAIKKGSMSFGTGRSGMTGGQPIIINVAGSVTSERDLVETVRRGLLQAQRNGRPVLA